MVFRDETFDPPVGIEAGEFLIRPVAVADAELDFEAVMESRSFLRLWEQSTWPEDDFTVEANREDLAKMVARHEERYAFGYTVMDPSETSCLGCIYLFPHDAKMYERSAITELADARWSDDVDVAASFWIRASRVEDGLDRRVLDTLRGWLADDWGFERVWFVTNEQFVQQVALFEDAGLTSGFRLREPQHAADYIAYAPQEPS